MSDRAAHQSYVGSRAVVSPHGPTSASRSSCRRSGFTPRGLFHNPRGFTLVEVVVAAAILLILLIGLSGVFARGVTGFKQAQLVTMAQNLAEFQVEDLKNLAPSVLNQLVFGKDADPAVGYQDVNYPYPTRDAMAENYDAAARGNDEKFWMYDSGKLRTDFMVDGVTLIGTTYVAGTTAMPAIPTDTDVLLGSNIVVERYGIDQVTGDPLYWEDGGIWYSWDGVTRTDLPGVPPGGTFYYYRIVLEKEAYPLFSRQVRVVQYDVSTPDGSDVWSTALDETLYRTFQGDARTKFDYEIVIWYKQNGVDRVLFRSGGTIAVPFAAVDTCGSVS
ncbi:MAG: prepilin-type N-terminal cleavage/methylation domain-containing protein [Caldiserica bacterium]|nr:prepilin-type N-terminal cleavage/methylation domain-containing protein [Caldisericota bacterium]